MNNSGIESDSSSDDEYGEKKKKRNKLGGNAFTSVDSTSRAYIKNVLLKYLEYMALA